jgi:S-DNA-T family DNA segregation ATPase FtsK/SpoIIIE
MSAHNTGKIYVPLSRETKIARGAESLRNWFLELMGNTARRSFGFLLVACAAAMAIALVSYDIADPSFDTATGRAAGNWLGRTGANLSDVLYQWLGLGALLLPFPLAVWGFRMLHAVGMDRVVLRTLAVVFGLVFAAAGLSALPSPLTLPAGSSGIAGRLAPELSAYLSGIFGFSWPFAVIPVLFAAASFVLLITATGLKWKDVLMFFQTAASLFAASGILAGRGAASMFKRTERVERAGKKRIEPTAGAKRGADDDHEPESYDDEDDGDVGEDEASEEEADDDAEELEPEDGEEESGEVIGRESGQPRVHRSEAPRKKPKGKTQLQPALALAEGEYELPSLGLLAEPPAESIAPAYSDEALEENGRLLVAVLGDFGVRGRITAIRPGPVVTLYELEPAAGVKSSRVISLSDDIARSMSAIAARVAVIPGRNVIGIELPNQRRETVYLRELFSAAEYEKSRAPLTLALGKTIGGEPVMADLAKMPHLLIAGTTGSGKSVALNTMILSILYRMPPEICRIIMIDPKMLELSVYDGIPHLLSPVVIDPKKAVVALKWAVREMESRYAKMAKVGVRGVEAFNERVKNAKAKGETLKRTVQTGFDRETGRPVYEDEVLDLEPMPYIVVVVDEMADLMMISGKEIEGAVQRLAQMARAAGIHLIAATQRPSVDVITGTIKANFPTRISFQVTSKIDSRTILGEQGAEQLLGQGDMLYMMAGGRIRRVHGPFVSDAEVEEVVRHLKSQGHPEYLEEVTEEAEEDEEGDDPYGVVDGDSGNALFDKAVAIVARERKVSTSYIQRRLQIGYNRAASLIEKMEDEGMISKPNHQGKREILLPDGRE